MKKIAILLLFILPILTIAQTDKEDIIGKWRGTNSDGSSVFFAFDAEGYAYMGDDQLQIGGKRSEIEGSPVSLSYTLDSSASPKQLDLIIKSLEEGINESLTMYMIFEFIDNDHVRILGGNDNERPSAFTDKAIVFERVKE